MASPPGLAYGAGVRHFTLTSLWPPDNDTADVLTSPPPPQTASYKHPSLHDSSLAALLLLFHGK